MYIQYNFFFNLLSIFSVIFQNILKKKIPKRTLNFVFKNHSIFKINSENNLAFRINSQKKKKKIQNFQIKFEN